MQNQSDNNNFSVITRSVIVSKTHIMHLCIYDVQRYLYIEYTFDRMFH